MRAVEALGTLGCWINCFTKTLALLNPCAPIGRPGIGEPTPNWDTIRPYDPCLFFPFLVYFTKRKMLGFDRHGELEIFEE